MSIHDLIGEVLEREGWPRYTNLPNDRGGPTKGGITQATLSGWRKRRVTPQDVASLGEDEARAIYRAEYVDEPGFADIADSLLQEQIVDCGVLHGTSRAQRWLQEAANKLGAGLNVDGDVGPTTLRAVNSLDPHRLSILIAGIRLRFMGEIISSNYKARRAGKTKRDQSEFALGWARRGTSFSDQEAMRT